MDKLAIRLLGQVEILHAEAAFPLQLTSASLKLLAYLLLNEGKTCRRDVLMDLFWRDSTPERARSCLNSTLWRLRRELESYGAKSLAYLVTTETGEIGFNWASDYWLDVQQFEQAVSPVVRKPVADVAAADAVQIEQSLALYRGELLEGFYDDWTLVERERLRLLYLNALTQLMTYYANSNAAEKSMDYARAILKQDPLREDIHRTLMQLYLATGQRSLAVQQYRTCAAILERELGALPMEETQQLYLQMVHPSAGADGTPVNGSTGGVDAEQHLRTVVRNLEQAHTHLKRAAHMMARLMHIKVSS